MLSKKATRSSSFGANFHALQPQVVANIVMLINMLQGEKLLKNLADFKARYFRITLRKA